MKCAIKIKSLDWLFIGVFTCAGSAGGFALDATVKSWKGYQKRMLHIKWQAGYFEHRLRNDDEFVEKMHYVRMNPVRKELVASPDAWPHSLVRADMAPGSVSIQGREPFIRAARQGRLALPGEENRKVEGADV